MGQMIGLARLTHEVDDRTRQMLLLSYAYHAPVCSYNVFDVDTTHGRQVVPALRWDSNGLSRFEVQTPILTLYRFGLEIERRNNTISQAQHDWLQQYTESIDGPGISKEHLPQLLLHSPYRMYAIPTYPVESFSHVQTLAALFRNVIIKPVQGSRGMGIRRVTHSADGLLISDGHAIKPLDRSNWDTYRKETNALGALLLQPCLNFTDRDNRPLSFRLLVARGADGDWHTLLMYGLLGTGGILSNVAQGAAVLDAQTALQAISGDKAHTLLQTLHMLSVELPKLIQSQRKRVIAALGIDVGIDRDSLQPYVIEANVSPGTSDGRSWILSEARVQYFRYLLSQS